MSNHDFLRVAGFAGVLAAICMIGITFTVDPTTFMPNSPLFPVLIWIGNLAGIILTLGLYYFYAQEAATLSKVAVGISLFGYLLFVINSFTTPNLENIVVKIADILVYIVGVSLFSWLAYSTRKGPRPLAIVGWLAALAGVGVYALMFGTGANMANPSHPMNGVLSVFYFAYLILVLVWLVWIGLTLVLRRPQLAMA